MASLIDNAMRTDSKTNGYPPYNIEIFDNDRYAITLAVEGHEREELGIDVELGVLTVCSNKLDEKEKNHLYQEIPDRAFERKFNLSDF